MKEKIESVKPLTPIERAEKAVAEARELRKKMENLAKSLKPSGWLNLVMKAEKITQYIEKHPEWDLAEGAIDTLKGLKKIAFNRVGGGSSLDEVNHYIKKIDEAEKADRAEK